MATYVKANNTTALNLTGSWVGGVVPGSADVGHWNSTVTGANTVALGAARTWLGVLITNPGGAVTVGTTTATWTIGASGIDMSSATQNLTINSPVSVLLGANQAWNVASGRTLTVSSVVSGASRVLSFNGAGQSVLTNANTYSGGSNISTGWVRVGNSAALGTGTITMTGGQLSSNSTTGYTLANALTLNGTMALGDATNNGSLTFSGGTAIGASGANLTVTNGTTIVFSGALTGSTAFTVLGGFGLFLTGQTGNTYSGAFTVNGANVYAGNPDSGVCNQLGSASSVTVTSGQFFYLGASAYTTTQTHTGAGLLATSNIAGVTFNGTMTGLTGTVQTFSDSTTSNSPLMIFGNFPTAAGNINTYNASTTSGTHTIRYAGSANVTAATTNFRNYATQSVSQTVSFQHFGTGGATMSLGGVVTNESANNIALKYDVGAGAGLLTLSGNITESSSGALSLEKLGGGAMTLSGNNTYKSSVTVSNGTLNAKSATALGADQSTGSVASGATLSLGAALNYSTRTWIINGLGNVSSGALIHAYVGTTKIGAITLGSTSYFRATETGTLSSSIAMGSSFSLTLGAAAGKTYTLSGGISSTFGTLNIGRTVSDAGTVALPTANTGLQGATEIFYGTLLLGNASAIGSGTLYFSGGYLDVSTPLTITNAVNLSANLRFGGTAALTLTSNIVLFTNYSVVTDGSGGALTLSGEISTNLGNPYKLTKSGINTLILMGVNTYSGGTDLTAGTTQAGSIYAFGFAGTVTLTSNSATLQTLTRGGLQNGKLTVAALDNSAGGVIKIGG